MKHKLFFIALALCTYNTNIISSDTNECPQNMLNNLKKGQDPNVACKYQSGRLSPKCLEVYRDFRQTQSSFVLFQEQVFVGTFKKLKLMLLVMEWAMSLKIHQKNSQLSL